MNLKIVENSRQRTQAKEPQISISHGNVNLNRAAMDFVGLTDSGPISVASDKDQPGIIGVAKSEINNPGAYKLSVSPNRNRGKFSSTRLKKECPGVTDGKYNYFASVPFNGRTYHCFKKAE